MQIIYKNITCMHCSLYQTFEGIAKKKSEFGVTIPEPF